MQYFFDVEEDSGEVNHVFTEAERKAYIEPPNVVKLAKEAGHKPVVYSRAARIRRVFR